MVSTTYPGAVNWIIADFWERDDCLGNDWVTREVYKRILGQCLAYFWLEKKMQLAVVWASSRVLKYRVLCVKKKTQLEQVRWWVSFYMSSLSMSREDLLWLHWIKKRFEFEGNLRENNIMVREVLFRLPLCKQNVKLN